MRANGMMLKPDIHVQDHGTHVLAGYVCLYVCIRIFSLHFGLMNSLFN